MACTYAWLVLMRCINGGGNDPADALRRCIQGGGYRQAVFAVFEYLAH